MRIKNLKLENFRNHKALTFDFPKDKNLLIFLGENGKGKTNFLEAIYALSLGRSFRTSSHEDLIMWENDYSRCKADIIKEDEKDTLEVFYSISPRKIKNFKKNDVKLSHKNFLGQLLTVLFQPEDLNMLYLSPSLRRRYLDIILSQTDRDYLEALSGYNKTVKQRNSLLARIRDFKFQGQDTTLLYADLDAWNHHLRNYGIKVIKKRLKFVEFLNNRIEEIYHSISGKLERITIEYKSKVSNNLEDIEEKFDMQMENRLQRDVFRAKTTFGPHLDDLIFFIEGKEISKSASRGEFRTLLLSIKLIEIQYIKEFRREAPILLLDDVFSELDEERKSKFLSAIKDCQTIITATDRANIGSMADVDFVDM